MPCLQLLKDLCCILSKDSESFQVISFGSPLLHPAFKNQKQIMIGLLSVKSRNMWVMFFNSLALLPSYMIVSQFSLFNKLFRDFLWESADGGYILSIVKAPGNFHLLHHPHTDAKFYLKYDFLITSIWCKPLLFLPLCQEWK